MKVKAAEEPPDWAAILAVVAQMLVNVGMDPAEAQQRINLWKARQHNLEGQALETLLPGMNLAEQAQQMLRWALEGEVLEDDLRSGAAALGMVFDPDPPFE